MMATGQVTVSINGVDYPMACTPGEEDKVIALGKRIDEWQGKFHLRAVRLVKPASW